MNKPLVVDAHEDIAFNSLLLKRNFFRSAHETRTNERDYKNGLATIGLPDLLLGNVRIVFAVIWAAVEKVGANTGLNSTATTLEEAHSLARKQLDFYKMLTEDPRISLIESKKDLERTLSTHEPHLGLLLLMEGADPISEPSEVHNWFKAGVRIVGPSWHGTRYAGGTGEPGPLTKEGRQLLSEMETDGLILDVSHLSEESFYEALEMFQGRVIASHSNSRNFASTSMVTSPDRHLSDDMIRALLSRDAIIGTAMYNGWLEPDWEQKGKLKTSVSTAAVARHIKHLCTIAGNTLQAGIGSDLDGGFGAESIPAELDTVADLGKIADALRVADFSEADIRNILGENWIRLLKETLPE